MGVEQEQFWLLSPATIRAMEAVMGSEMKPIAQSKEGPFTIEGKGVRVDFHPLPDGQTWVNITPLEGEGSHLCGNLIPSEVSVRSNFEKPEVVEVLEFGRGGWGVIFPRDGEVTFEEVKAPF